MSLDHVVVDVEIAKTIEETPGGWDATDKLGVAVACLWEYNTERMRVYGPEEVPDLRERLLKADRISGYNIWNFDFPVIWGVSKEKWKDLHVIEKMYGKIGAVREQLAQKANDLLRRIWISLGLNPDFFSDQHKGLGLDAVAMATIGASKIGHGAEAPKWYQAGKIQKVANYCADDVAMERDLVDFVDQYGYVIDPRSGKKILTGKEQ